jgi:hypothetical protein
MFENWVRLMIRRIGIVVVAGLVGTLAAPSASAGPTGQLTCIGNYQDSAGWYTCDGIYTGSDGPCIGQATNFPNENHCTGVPLSDGIGSLP